MGKLAQPTAVSAARLEPSAKPVSPSPNPKTKIAFVDAVRDQRDRHDEDRCPDGVKASPEDAKGDKACHLKG